ncbi:hypothetical protein Q4534_15160 [Cyclobacterium sp. 1_MG-2023]|uniref:hypothetical protein n=1 Tax=Cyclobacterium sp. 1_MG-2023 TaxID=3062681 RepID=UPI0026E36967|nr:hypothetical protein [Cyclobacterium sp. 1_MG-2023]MDO6438761.1 hypothetical protein [Cyclobacterium sp. 1_MG-2023]
MITKRISWILIVLSILIGGYFYGIAYQNYAASFLQLFAVVPFLMFMAGVHGLLTHNISPRTKHNMLVYPLVMGLIYVVMFFIHLFIIFPLICPGL